MKTLHLVLVLIGAGVLFAQPDIAWVENFGGGQRDYAYKFIADTALHRYYVLGSRETPADPSYDRAQIACWNDSGELQWSRFGGDPQSNTTYIHAGLTSSGGLVAIEVWFSPPVDPDTSGYRIIRYSATGDTSWIRDWIVTYWDSFPDPSIPRSLTPHPEGGFYICSNGSRSYITEYDEAGDTLLNCGFGYPSILLNPKDIVLVEGRAILFGLGSSSSNSYLIELVLPPPFFDFTWLTSMPYVSSAPNTGFTQLPNGDFAYAGQFYWSNDDSVGWDGWITKTGSHGELKWSRVLGSAGNGEEFVDVIPTLDGNIAAVGVQGGEIWLVKLDTSGAVLWETTYNMGEGVSASAVGFAQLSDGSFMIGGEANLVSSGFPDFILIRTEPDIPTSLPETDIHLPVEFQLKQNFPNPFNASTQIEFELSQTAPVKITVFDVTGREVQTLVNGTLTSGRYQYYFHANDLASGVYFYRLQAGVTIETKKMMLLK